MSRKSTRFFSDSYLIKALVLEKQPLSHKASLNELKSVRKLPYICLHYKVEQLLNGLLNMTESKKKRLGFILTTSGWGGLEMNALRLAKWMDERGWDIVLFTYPEVKVAQEAQLNYPVTVVPIKPHKKYFDWVSAKRLKHQLKEYKIETLIIFDNFDFDLVTWTKRLGGNKLQIFFLQQMKMAVSKKSPIHTYRFAGLDYWIAPLELLKTEMLERTRIERDKIKVIPLCLEVEALITPQYTKEEARKLLEIRPKYPLLGIIGRIDAEKGQFILLQALWELKQQGVPLELLIVGETTINHQESEDYFIKIQKFIAEHDLADVVHIRSFRKDVQAFYRAVDIFGLGSKAETFGMVTVEAMLSGLPIVASNAAGTPEVLGFGKYGKLYAPSDVQSCMKEIKWCLENSAEAKQMGIMAKEYAAKQFSHNRECEAIEALIADRYQLV